ncbi:MAG: FCD domain-containing protein [Synergistaceae bacterium]|nr:FCD domain-containing protein [Synergistaceae bacterium]
MYNTEHRKIFEAIEQRDADMAKLTMRRHLDNLMQSVEKTE